MPTLAELSPSLASALQAATNAMSQTVTLPNAPTADMQPLKDAIGLMDQASDKIVAFMGSPPPPPPPPPSGTVTLNGFTVPDPSGSASSLPRMGRVSVTHNDRSGAAWRASDWSGGSHHDSEFEFKNVLVHPNGVVDLVLSGVSAAPIGGEAELQEFGVGEVKKATIRSDIEFFRMRSGVVAAPGWTYRYNPGKNDPGHADELDWEVVGLTGIHLYGKKAGVDRVFKAPLIVGDMSGRRFIFGLDFKVLGEPDDFVSWKLAEVVGGVAPADIPEVFRWTPAQAPMPVGAMRTFMSLWGDARDTPWAGDYTDPAPGSEPVMRIHGFSAQVF